MIINDITQKFDRSNCNSEKIINFINEQNEVKKKLESYELKPSEKRDFEDKYKFIGKFINITYSDATLLTNDDVIFYNGGIPRSSFLIATLDKFKYDKIDIPVHFMLLKVIDTAPTPATQEMTRTYLEWNKKANPELDDFTKSDLKWSALKCEIKGQFYQDGKNLKYASDLNFQMSPLNYNVYKPSLEILNIILNNEFLSKKDGYIPFLLGEYRPIENLLNWKYEKPPEIYVDINDFLGKRTAMFGKTRLGKSNTVKLIIKNLLENIDKSNSKMGQIIFDVNGEYGYSNNQDAEDGMASCIKEMFPNDCIIYSFSPRDDNTKALKLNFYNNPKSGLNIIKELLNKEGNVSGYISSFLNIEIASNLIELENLKKSNEMSEYTKKRRKVLMYWCVLEQAGFKLDDKTKDNIKGLNPNYNKKSRSIAYNKSEEEVDKIVIKDFKDLLIEFKNFYISMEKNPNEDFGKPTQNKSPIFDNDDKAILKFLFASDEKKLGTSILKKYKEYHSEKAEDFASEILNLLESGKTVILDLCSATDEIRRFFSDMISKKIFIHQENKFIKNSLNDHYIQIYFEEAHNIFPIDNDPSNIYARFAKEGAKYNIGIVYSTQSPSTINKELLNQTENFFIGHISSPSEMKIMANLNVEFIGIEEEVLRNKQKGYMRVLTNSHRFVIPIQIKIFNK